MREWVGEIRFAPEVAAKIATKHNVSPDEVREAVACGAHTDAVWDHSGTYGPRLVLTGTTADGVDVIAYLRPLDREDGLWECLTAWRM